MNNTTTIAADACRFATRRGGPGVSRPLGPRPQPDPGASGSYDAYPRKPPGPIGDRGYLAPLRRGEQRTLAHESGSRLMLTKSVSASEPISQTPVGITRGGSSIDFSSRIGAL